MTTVLVTLLTVFVLYSFLITAMAIHAAGALNDSEAKRNRLEAVLRIGTGTVTGRLPDFEQPPIHSPLRGHHRSLG